MYSKLMKEVGEEASKSVYRSWEMVAEEVLQKYEEIIEKYNKSNNDI